MAKWNAKFQLMSLIYVVAGKNIFDKFIKGTLQLHDKTLVKNHRSYVEV